MGFHSLKDVLQEQLEDLHSAETQLIAALPKMAQAAHHDQLREAFETHLEETQGTPEARRGGAQRDRRRHPDRGLHGDEGPHHRG